MRCRFLFFVAAVLAFPAGVAVSQPTSGRKPDPTAELLAKLRKPTDFDRAEGTLDQFVANLDEKHGVPVVINETAFRATDPNMNPASFMVKVPGAKGTSVAGVLPRVLGPIDATFLICKNHIEIVPVAHAAVETKNIAPSDGDEPPKLAQPLVSMIFKEKPLNEALAEIAEEYDLTIVVLPQSGDARTGFVTARLLNTPADQAIEILALQNDLRVVRKANAFLITTRDHANDLFGEQMDRERQKIELEKFRIAPYQPPQPPPPQPQPQPAVVPIPPPPKQP